MTQKSHLIIAGLAALLERFGAYQVDIFDPLELQTLAEIGEEFLAGIDARRYGRTFEYCRCDYCGGTFSLPGAAAYCYACRVRGCWH